MSLTLNEITVTFHKQKVVDNISFVLEQGDTLGIIGESGSGKTMLAKTLLGLVPHPGKVSVGQLRMFKRDYYLGKEDLALLRGKKIAMIVQDPFMALDPIMPVGMQIAESFVVHQSMSWPSARHASAKMLQSVNLDKEIAKNYPHQLSGGMAQRVVIAMMLACQPKVLIADEITSALDVATRRDILNLIKKLADLHNMSVIMISHDVHQVVEYCTNILVMWHGKCVEYTKSKNLAASKHHYTQALLNCMPHKSKRGRRLVDIDAESLDASG